VTGPHTAASRLPTVAVILVVLVVSALAATYLVGQGGWINNNNNSTAMGTTSKTNCVSDSGPHSIGYVGCSNTADAITGYYLVPNGGLFWQPYPTGGGSLDLWTSGSSRYWSLFDRQVQKYGQPSKVWIEICERAAAPLDFAMVQEMFAILRLRAPSATYYISPLNSYSPSNICTVTGPNGVADATNLANEAVSKGLALAGPTIGPLTSQNTVSDMCHPNTGGESLLGSQLASFFGR